jgi:hypothetical protein
VKELLAAGSDYAGTYPMVVMIDMDPKTRIPMTTVGMLFKHPMSPKEARVRLQALLLSVTQQLEKDLDTSSILLDQCQKHHSMAEKGKVAGSDAEPVLKQMLEFCQKCLGCEGDIVGSATALMGTYSKIKMNKTKFGFDSIVTLCTPQDVATKETATDLGSDAFQNTKVCWR